MCPFNPIYKLPVPVAFAEFPGARIVVYRKEQIVQTAACLIHNHIITVV